MRNGRQGVRSALVYIFYLNLCICYVGGFREGQQCFDTAGRLGQCIALRNCGPALNLYYRDIRPFFCNPFCAGNLNDLVCCQHEQVQHPHLPNYYAQNPQPPNFQGQYPQLENPQFKRPQLGDPQFKRPPLGDPQFKRPQLGDPQFKRPQLGDPPVKNPPPDNIPAQNPQLGNIQEQDPQKQDPQQQSAGVQNVGERVSVQKCNEYHPEIAESLGTVSVVVVGGTKALSKTYTHMALVGYGDMDYDTSFCGGSLISEKFVMTAAHCLDTSLGAPQWVRLGELDTANDTEEADPQDIRVIRSIPHPQYQDESYYHDIGLLELERTVTFSEYIRPACLFQTHDIDGYLFAIATGWGHTFFAGRFSSHLMEVSLMLVNNTFCSRFYRGLPKTRLAVGIDDNNQICAGGDDKDTCQGDSGGPLQVKKTGVSVYDVIGITSFGTACGIGNAPGIYTRVSFYLDWIESIVWPQS